MNNEYKQGQQDMLALMKDAYHKADKETFEKLLDTDDESEALNFLKHEYIKRGMKTERARLLKEIRGLAEKYGINI